MLAIHLKIQDSEGMGLVKVTYIPKKKKPKARILTLKFEGSKTRKN